MNCQGENGDQFVYYPADLFQEHDIVVAQLPTLSADRSTQDRAWFDGHRQLWVILMHDELLYAGEGRALEPEVTVASRLHDEMLMSVPADAQYDLALFVANRFAHEEVAIVVQQADDLFAGQDAMEPLLLVQGTIRG